MSRSQNSRRDARSDVDGAQPSDKARSNPPLTRGLVRAVFRGGTPLLTFVAAALYVVLRVGYDSFYGALRLSPEEVGISQTTVIVQAAASILIVAVLLAYLVSVVLVWFMQFSAEINRLPSRASVEIILAGALFVGYGVLEWQLAPVLSQLPKELNPITFVLRPSQPVTGPYVSGVFAALVGAGFSAYGVFLYARGRTMGVVGQAGVRGLIFVSVVALLQLTLVGSVQYGRVEAAVVQSGHPLNPHSSASHGFDFSLFAFRADSVCISWVGPDQPASLDLSVPLLYLGRAESVLVLYRAPRGTHLTDSSGPIRVNGDKVVLTSVDENTLVCPTKVSAGG